MAKHSRATKGETATHSKKTEKTGKTHTVVRAYTDNKRRQSQDSTYLFVFRGICALELGGGWAFRVMGDTQCNLGQRKRGSEEKKRRTSGVCGGSVEKRRGERRRKGEGDEEKRRREGTGATSSQRTHAGNKFKEEASVRAS